MADIRTCVAMRVLLYLKSRRVDHADVLKICVCACAIACVILVLLLFKTKVCLMLESQINGPSLE